LKTSGTLRVTAETIPGPREGDPRTLEQQVWGVADYVTGIVQQGLCSKPNHSEKEKHQNAH